ncbi:MAG: HPF/RaiA family ribosome-associated protein [Gammaproteobacteria bacterium]|jgi:ribosome-associated translation inhibitor RaiA
MQIIIQSHNLKVSRSLEQLIRKQANKVMGAYSHHIERLIIRLKHVTQPNGTSDPQCCVEVRLPQQPNVVVVKRSANVRSTIKKTMARAGRATLQQLSRRRTARLSGREVRHDVERDPGIPALG